jgi:hypothetical protein
MVVRFPSGQQKQTKQPQLESKSYCTLLRWNPAFFSFSNLWRIVSFFRAFEVDLTYVTEINNATQRFFTTRTGNERPCRLLSCYWLAAGSLPERDREDFHKQVPLQAEYSRLYLKLPTRRVSQNASIGFSIRFSIRFSTGANLLLTLQFIIHYSSLGNWRRTK